MELLQDPDCAAVAQAFGTMSTELETALGYQALCESPNCLSKALDAATEVENSAACQEYRASGAAVGDLSMTDIFELSCRRRDAETYCIEWLMAVSVGVDIPGYTKVCEPNFNMSFAEGVASGADYLCCAVTEGGCCLGETLKLQQTEAEFTSFAEIVNGAICGEGSFDTSASCPTPFEDACSVRRTYKLTEFSGLTRERDLAQSIAASLSITPSRVGITSVIASGGVTTVNIEISVICAEREALQNQWNEAKVDDVTAGTGTTITVDADQTTAAVAESADKLIDPNSSASSSFAFASAALLAVGAMFF